MLLNHNTQNDDCLLIAQKVTTVSCRSCVKLGPLVHSDAEKPVDGFLLSPKPEVT
jgi:hypothetical protein